MQKPLTTDWTTPPNIVANIVAETPVKDQAAVLIAESLAGIHRYQRWQFYAILITAISLIGVNLLN